MKCGRCGNLGCCSISGGGGEGLPPAPAAPAAAAGGGLFEAMRETVQRVSGGPAPNTVFSWSVTAASASQDKAPPFRSKDLPGNHVARVSGLSRTTSPSWSPIAFTASFVEGAILRRGLKGYASPATTPPRTGDARPVVALAVPPSGAHGVMCMQCTPLVVLATLWPRKHVNTGMKAIGVLLLSRAKTTRPGSRFTQ